MMYKQCDGSESFFFPVRDGAVESVPSAASSLKPRNSLVSGGSCAVSCLLSPPCLAAMSACNVNHILGSSSHFFFFFFYDSHSQDTHQLSLRLFLTNAVQNAINMGPQLLNCSSCFGFYHDETLFLLSLPLLFNLPLGTTLGL